MDNTAFIREIQDQPSALKAVADYYSTGEGRIALAKAVDTIQNAGKLVFTGMGTSWHAVLSVMPDLVPIVPACELWDAGELFHFSLDTIKDGTILFAISQSGESAETRAVVKAYAGKSKIIGMVNNTGSTIGQLAHITLPLMGGAEASISTKTYTNTLAVLRFVADGLTGIPVETTAQALFKTADNMEKYLEDSAENVAGAAQYFEGVDTMHVIARGHDLAAAMQWSLILKEGACVSGLAMSAGQFRHGPIEMGGPGLAVACFVSEDAKPELTISLAEELADMGSRVLIIGDREYNTALEQVVIQSVSPQYFPISSAPFIELFVHEMAKQRGRTAGIFFNAVKVTDKE